MTQPRSAQIKSVNTRYSVLRHAVTPGSASASLALSAFPSPPGGADHDVPARVRGAALSPFPVLAGDTFSVSLDGAPPVLVALAPTDTTVGRVALKVNAALSVPLASNDAGHLVLTSTASGAGSSIALADVTPGALSKFGLTAGTLAGVTAPADGVLTLSPDALGGSAPHSTVDGRNLVTDGGKLVYFSHVSGASGRKLMQLLPGGVPVVGKLTSDGSSILCSYHARLLGRARLRTFGSFFSLLTNSDVLTMNVNGIGFATTFASPPYTRDQVLDAINAAYAAAAGISDTFAVADGTSPSPYRDLAGTSFMVEVDGGAPQTVSFVDETSAEEVAAVISLSLVGAGAVVTNGPNGKYVTIGSDNANGRTSSLKIYSADGSLVSLGIRAGYYGGTYVADRYGPDEVEIFSVYRGYSLSGSPEITATGSATTLARMGLSTTFVAGAVEPTYEPVPAPFFSADMSSAPPYDALMCFPDVLEFGEVPADSDAVLQEFLAKSAGTNVNEANRPVNDGQDGSIRSAETARGFFDVGKPLVTAPDGIGGQGGFAPADAIVKQITRLSATEVVQAVVGSKFETPGNGSNPLPTQPFMDLYADPTNSYTHRGFRFFLDPVTAGMSAVDDPGGATPLLRSYLGVHGTRTVYFPDDDAKVSDRNISSIDTVNGYMLISSAGDNYLRVGGEYAIPGRPNVIGYNLLRSTNARYEVYLGDGDITTGDFNGPDALSQALAFLSSRGVVRCRIVMKPGNYSENAPVVFSGFSDVHIEGAHPYGDSPAVTLNINFPGTGVSCPDHMSSFVCRNVRFTAFDATQPAMDVNSDLCVVEGCAFQSPMLFLNPGVLRVSGCLSPCQAAGPVVVRYDDNAPSEVDSLLIKDCVMSSGQDFPIVTVQDSTSFESVRVDCISIARCSLKPGTATFSGVSAATTPRAFVSPVGAGVISIVPSGNAFGSPLTGIVVQNLDILQVEVALGVLGTTVNASFVALNLVPSGPGGNGTWSYGANPAVALNNVRVEDLLVSFPNNGGLLQMQSPCIAIGGVGIAPLGGGFPPGAGVGTLTFKRVTVDVQLNIHGPITANLLPFFNQYVSVPLNTQSNESGLVCLSGASVVAEDLAFTNTIDRCGSPELFVSPYSSLSLRKLLIHPVIGGGPSSALTVTQARLYVRNVFGALIEISHVTMDGGGSSDANWANLGMIVYEGSLGRGVSCRISDFSIQNFFFSFAIPGISVRVANGHASWPTNARGGGVMIERGYVGNSFVGSSGTNGFLNGISAVVGSPNVVMDDIHIRDVTVDSTQGNGILIALSSMDRAVSVEDCHILLCGNGGGNSGIKVQCQRTTSNNAAGFSVRDNACYMNNLVGGGGFTNVQINVRDTGSDFRPTLASVYGNNCLDNSGGGLGEINSCSNSGTNLPASGSAVSGNVLVLGIETGYVGSAAPFGNDLVWTPAFRCIHNLANLSADFSYAF